LNDEHRKNQIEHCLNSRREWLFKRLDRIGITLDSNADINGNDHGHEVDLVQCNPFRTKQSGHGQEYCANDGTVEDQQLHIEAQANISLGLRNRKRDLRCYSGKSV
jgi:hypothetical protein